jgi:AcrR family transcriptional regulator
VSQVQVFGELAPLPHGPHRISPDQVAASQIARLRAAMVAEVARHGYAGTTITAVVRRARVSPNVFYRHYPDKQACFRDALEVAAEAVIGIPVGSPRTTEELAAQLVRPYLDLVEAAPDAARAMMIEIDGAGPEIRQRRRELFAVAAAALRVEHERLLGRPSASAGHGDKIYLAILHAGHGLVCDWLEEHPGEPVVDLQPTLIEVVTLLLLGAGPAAGPPEGPASLSRG